MLGVDSFIDLSEFNTWVNWYMALFEAFCGVFCELLESNSTGYDDHQNMDVK